VERRFQKGKVAGRRCAGAFTPSSGGSGGVGARGSPGRGGERQPWGKASAGWR
jgi:hypothetical protein